jgi:ABC-type lipoprotein release transport system permease subunit
VSAFLVGVVVGLLLGVLIGVLIMAALSARRPDLPPSGIHLPEETQDTRPGP